MMLRLTVITGMLLALLLAVGCFGTGTGPKAAGELVVLNHEMVKDEAGHVAVLVTVKNVGPGEAELAEVTVSFFDADKGLIDSSSDSVMRLGPDESWDFQIACEAQRCAEVKSYEIETMAGASSGGFSLSP